MKVLVKYEDLQFTILRQKSSQDQNGYFNDIFTENRSQNAMYAFKEKMKLRLF